MEWTLVSLLLLEIWGKKDGSTSTITKLYGNELYIQISTLKILNAHVEVITCYHLCLVQHLCQEHTTLVQIYHSSLYLPVVIKHNIVREKMLKKNSKLEAILMLKISKNKQSLQLFHKQDDFT